MKFLVDRCAGHRLAEWLCTQGFDVVEARERVPDPGDEELLRWAACENRVLITIDTDFGDLIFRYEHEHCGLVRLPDVPADQRIGLMVDILEGYSSELKRHAVVTVKGRRIRISRHP